ncbi:MAG: pentapeptide repeat-containing protein [Cyanobacteria bacterium J06648_11]
MCGKLWILSGVAVGITLAACGSETISAIAPVSESGDRVSTIYFDDTDRVQLRDVALALAAANVPEGDRETLAAAAIALLGANPNISTDLIFPDPLIADFDFAEPEGAIDLSDVATIQAALAIAPQNRTASALATTANRLFAPTAPLTASRIRVIPGEGIPVPSSQPSTLPIPNATDLNTLLTRLECNDCQLQGANLSATEIAIDLEGAVLRQSDLSFANLTRATLVGGDLTLAIAREVTAVETDFREATLLSVDFRDSALRGATFADSGLRGAILSSVDLRAADFSEADLTDTDLSDANLSDAIFNRATFERTQLDRAILVRADFSGVSLATTDFTAADLRGADFRTANLQDAILTDARFDDTTQFPTGFDPERAGLSRQP